jgi:hypothetical protein
MILFNTDHLPSLQFYKMRNISGIQDCCKTVNTQTCLDVGDEHVDNGGPGLVQRLVPDTRPKKINGFNHDSLQI